MVTIFLESILFVAVIATLAALLLFALLEYTALGVRLRQVRNRKRLERAAELVCPVHGAHLEQELVRLSGGNSVCPDCFQEAINGKLD